MSQESLITPRIESVQAAYSSRDGAILEMEYSLRSTVNAAVNLWYNGSRKCSSQDVNLIVPWSHRIYSKGIMIFPLEPFTGI
jgi:hypothetical protein